MDKKSLTEADMRTKFITPALVGADGGKWDVMTQLREEIYFTRGRVIVRGKTVKRGEAKKADYLLYYKPGIPIAVIEAKDNTHAVGAGMQQALEYAEILDVPFAYVELVCGEAPLGSKLDIMWSDHELGNYPSLGVWFEFGLPSDYINSCERALEVFDQAVSWNELKKHFEKVLFSQEEDENDHNDEGI